MGDNVSAVGDANFDAEVLQSDVPVLVDFWATWCGPCKAIAPLVNQLATENGGKLKVVKVDIQTNPRTPARFKVVKIPTLLVFKGGEVVARQVGAGGGLAKLRQLVAPALG